MGWEVQEQEMARFLWRHGHFWNPDYPDTHNVKFDDLEDLTEKDTVFKQAVASWQSLDVNFDVFGFVMHLRRIIADGDIGPATLAMFDVPRCPVPDHAPTHLAEADWGLDEDIRPIAASMREFQASGEGSWLNCDPTKSFAHSIRVRIDPAGMPTGVKGYIHEALDACVKLYAEVGFSVRYILDANSPAEIVKDFGQTSVNVIGWNYFPTPNSCQTIRGRFSNRYAPSDWRMWANLEGHETGHGCGANHGSGHIMNPTILLIWPLSWVGSYTYPHMKRWFGGQPLPTIPTDPPPPGPGDPNGLFTLDGELYKLWVKKSK